MRKWIAGFIVGAIAVTTATSFAITYKKARLGVQDARFGYGTYSVSTSTGGTETINEVSPVNAIARGVIPGDGIDDCDSLQALVDELGSIGRGTVYLPSGVYDLRTPHKGYSDAYPSGNGSLINLPAGVNLVGDGVSTILRVGGSVGNYTSVVHQNNYAQTMVGKILSNLTIDQNSDSNTIASAGDLTDNYRFAVQVYQSRGLTIDHVLFDNPAGTNTITVNGRENTVNTTISNCEFRNVGGGSVNYDHSTIYLHGDGMKVVNCTFTGRQLYGRVYGNRTAIETHGPNQIVSNNYVNKYRTFANITGISSVESKNVVVVGNQADNMVAGINLWSRTYAGHMSGIGLSNVTIVGNVFHIVPADSATSNERHGITTSTSSTATPLPIKNMVIANNVISYQKHDASLPAVVTNIYSAAIGLYCASAKVDTMKFIDVSVQGNIIENAPVTGIRLAGTMKNVRVVGNSINKSGTTQYTTSITSASRSGIMAYIRGGNGIDISGNRVFADSTCSKYGIYLGSTAACTLMTVNNNIIRGIPAGYYPIYLTEQDNLRSSGFHMTYDVGEWGATGTQDKADASVISSVLRAAAYAGGGDVYFPEGHYITGSNIGIDTTTVRVTGFAPDSLSGGSPRVIFGTGAPENVAWAPIGSIYQRVDGTTNGTSLYYKTSGTGRTGWVRRNQFNGVYSDSLYERTSAAGIRADGALLKDGAYIPNINTVLRAADDSLAVTEETIVFSGQTGNVYCTLPTYASVAVGKVYKIINADATATDSVFVEANGAELLNGFATRKAVPIRGVAAAAGSSGFGSTYYSARIIYCGSTVGWIKVD